MFAKIRNWLVLALVPGLLHAQVVFSRRVYNPQAKTYNQLWLWDPADGSLMPLTSSARNHFQPSCPADARRIDFLSGTDDINADSRWSFDRTTRSERRLPADSKARQAAAKKPAAARCSDAVWTPDRRRYACVVGQEIAIYGGPEKETGRTRFTQRPTPPGAIAWSPDGKWLLVGTMGENDNSTQRQSDYFALDSARMSWLPAGSGNDAMWLPGRNEIVYSTPRDLVSLAPSSRHKVWSSQLVVFDPASSRTTPVTSGVSNNVQPAPCRRR